MQMLTNLLSINKEYMSFSSNYLWIALDDCHFLINEVTQIDLLYKYNKFEICICEIIKTKKLKIILIRINFISIL